MVPLLSWYTAEFDEKEGWACDGLDDGKALCMSPARIPSRTRMPTSITSADGRWILMRRLEHIEKDSEGDR